MVDLTYSEQVQPEPLPGRAYPHLPGQVPAGAFGEEVGAGLERAGDIEAQVVRHAEQTQLMDAHNQLQRISLDTTHNPDNGFFSLQGKNAIGAGPAYLQRYDDQAKQVLEGIPSRRARQSAQLASDQIRTHLAEQIDTHTLQQTKEYGVKTAQTTVQLAQQAAAANYNHADMIALNADHMDAALETLGKQQGWSDEMLAEAKYQHHVILNEGVLANQLADHKVDMAKAYFDQVRGTLRPADERKFQTAIEAGQVDDEANRILSAYRQDAGIGGHELSQLEGRDDLTPEQKSHIVQKAEQGRRELAMERQGDPAIRRQIVGVDDAIAGHTATTGTLGAIESLWRRGALTDEQHDMKREEVVRALREGSKVDEDLQYVTQAYKDGTQVGTDHAKGVNALLAMMTPNDPVGSTGYNQAAASIVAKVGVIPESAKNYMTANLMSGTPQEAVKAARLVSAIERTGSMAYMQLPERTRAMAAQIIRADESGANAEEMVDIARDNAKMDEGTRKRLDEVWRTQASGKKNFDWEANDSQLIHNDLKTDDHYAKPGKLWGHDESSVPDVPRAMADEFGALTKAYFYHTGGDIQQARAIALSDLKHVWGVTEVNGKRELMKFAPERMVPGLKPETIRADLAKEGYGAAHLVESPETGSSGGRVWWLAEPNQFGGWQEVKGADGKKVRYELPAPEKRQTWEDDLKDYEARQAARVTKAAEDSAAKFHAMEHGR